MFAAYEQSSSSSSSSAAEYSTSSFVDEKYHRTTSSSTSEVSKPTEIVKYGKNTYELLPYDLVLANKICCLSIPNNLCSTVIDRSFYVAACALELSETYTNKTDKIAEKHKRLYHQECFNKTETCIRENVNEKEVGYAKQVQEKCGLGLGEEKCTDKCSGYGKCSLNGCVCTEGYTGEKCQFSAKNVTQEDYVNKNLPKDDYVPVTSNLNYLPGNMAQLQSSSASHVNGFFVVAFALVAALG